ncbi:hypothetical protein Y032_0378g286 [Ancylostoma ceylanicum]|nr:hypothetical protein Y032_0378g286 [Ancylostoma ceylanicum]
MVLFLATSVLMFQVGSTREAASCTPKKDTKKLCVLCNKLFSHYYLATHLKTAHGDAGREEAEKMTADRAVHCTSCTYTGPNQEALKRHIRRMHAAPERESNESLRWSCPLCSAALADQAALNEHCRTIHELTECAVLTRTFASVAEFEVWKSETERLHVTSWKRSSVNVSSIEKHTIKHFVCHRSGVVRRVGKGLREPHESRISTRHCTSFLKAQFNDDGTVTARFCLEHVGHAVSACRLPLTDGDKQAIGHYLQLGLDVPTVLRVMRKLYNDPRYRLYWLTPSDIRNTQRSLSMQPGRLHEDDLRSLEIRYQKKADADGIRRFDLPTDETGTGFRLIIITPEQVEILRRYSHKGVSIDDTHCTTRYSLKLTTLMVVDDYGRGLPAGFLLANKMDKEECVYFFEEVKKVFGEFMPRFFLSDDTNTFWNGYKSVFPGSFTVKLLCSWHCQRAIFEKIASLFPGKGNERRKTIKGWVKSLFTQSNKVEFFRAKNKLLTLLHQWRVEKNKSAEKFDAYFRKQYLARQEQWAPYNRTAAIANTTMVSERWHRTLKYTLLNRSANHRADELVHTLLVAIPELTREHLVQDERGIKEGKFRAKENARRHKRAVEQQQKIKLTRVGSNEWLVDSFEVPGRQYKITVNQCSCENIKTHCCLCGICSVGVNCSCPDGVKKGIACKHAHAWALFHDDEADFVAASGEESTSVALEASPVHVSDTDEVVEAAHDADLEEDQISRVDVERQAVAKLQELTDRICFALNSVKVSGSDERIARLERATEKMWDILVNDLDGASLPRLVPRRHCPTRGRVVTTKQESLQGKQTQKMARRSATVEKENITSDFHPGDIDVSKLNICVICNYSQPELENPEDEEVMQEALIDWWACNKCKSWAHLDCLATRDCSICGGVYEPTE